MKTLKLKSIIRSLIKEELTTEVRVINYKNGVTAAIGDRAVTLAHPTWGNRNFKRYGSYNRYKTPDGDELELINLVNKYADGKLGKGDKPYRKPNKPSPEPTINLIKPEVGRYRTINYKNGVTAKVYDNSVNLSHPKYGKKSFRKYGSSYRYITPKGEFEILPLVKKFAAGELSK